MTHPNLSPQLPNPETAHVSPERALFDVIRGSYTNIPVQEAMLAQGFEAAKATLDVKDELTVDVVGNILQSMMFGSYGDPLPLGLVYGVRYDELPHRTYLAEDPAIFKPGNLFGCGRDGSIGSILGGGGIAGQLMQYGLSDLMKLRAQQRCSNKDAITETAVGLISSQPAVQLLRSFDTLNPVRHQEVRLTNNEIAAGKARLRNIAERSLGPLAFEPDARQLIDRMTSRSASLLEQETVRRRVPARHRGADAYSRLQDYFRKAAFEMLTAVPENEELKEAGTRADFVNITEYSSGSISLEYRDKEYLATPSELSLYIAASIVPYTSLYFDINRVIINDSIVNFFAREGTGYKDFVGNLIDASYDRNFRPMTEHDAAAHEHRIGWHHYLRLNGYQASPWLHTKEHLDASKPQLSPIAHRTAGFVDKASSAHEDSVITGSVWIDKRYADGKPRMMEYVSVDAIDLPQAADNVVMTVQHYDTGTWDGTTIPKVDGYVTATYEPTTATFGFIPDPRGDICANRCEVPLPAADRTKAAALCAAMGLNAVANDLHGTPEVTVADLADTLRASSRYRVPQKGSSVRITKPEDLRQFVEKDILNTQCRISRELAVLVFKPIFGEGSVRIRNGVLIDGKASQTLTLATHTNILLAVEGREYPIDLTPSHGAGTVGAGVRSLARFLLGARPEKRQPPATGVTIAEQATISDIQEQANEGRMYINPSDVRAAEARLVTDALTTNLCETLDVTSVDKLHRTLSSPKYYPIRQAFRLAESAKNNQLSKEAVAEYLTLLDNIALPKSRRAAAYGKYDSDLLNILRAHVHSLPISEK